jgi:hypothetical protein
VIGRCRSSHLDSTSIYLYIQHTYTYIYIVAVGGGGELTSPYARIRDKQLQQTSKVIRALKRGRVALTEETRSHSYTFTFIRIHTYIQPYVCTRTYHSIRRPSSCTKSICTAQQESYISSLLLLLPRAEITRPWEKRRKQLQRTATFSFHQHEKEHSWARQKGI